MSAGRCSAKERRTAPSLACSLHAVRAALALTLLVMSCGGDPGPGSPGRGARGPRAERAEVARGASGEGVAALGPASVKLAANAACEACHATESAEWRGSLHARAWDDPVFLAAYAIEPLPFCRGCHAPEAPLDQPSSPARHLGVACISCHVPEAEAQAEGHTRFVRRAGDPGGCAGCHQFEFPEPQAAAMQSTVAEHAASKHHDRSCVDCHMPASPSGAGRSHAFRVQGDSAMLRRAIEASAARVTARVLVVSLVASGAGHAVPTGDMFRQLEVHAVAGAGPGALSAAPVVLSREFAFARGQGGPRRLQTDDRRVPASGEPREARLVFPGDVDALPIRWKVVYHRMGPREAELFGVDREAEAIVIAEGMLPASPARTPNRRIE